MRLEHRGVLLLAMVAMCGCTSLPVQRVTAGALNSETKAKELVGQVFENKEGTESAGFVAFQVSPSDLEPAGYIGTYKVTEDQKRSLELAASYSFAQACTASAGPKVKISSFSVKDITFTKRLQAAETKWLFQGTCCSEGNVSEHCKGKGVATAVYEATIKFDAKTDGELAGGATVECLGVPVTVEGKDATTGTVAIQSSGWNVVYLQDPELVCASLAKQ
jgi:hypothetical protein